MCGCRPYIWTAHVCVHLWQEDYVGSLSIYFEFQLNSKELLFL